MEITWRFAKIKFIRCVIWNNNMDLMPVLVGIWDIIDSLIAIGKQYRKKQ